MRGKLNVDACTDGLTVLLFASFTYMKTTHA